MFVERLVFTVASNDCKLLQLVSDNPGPNLMFSGAGPIATTFTALGIS